MNPPTNDATVPETAQRVRGTVRPVVRPFPVALRRVDGRHNICCDERQLMTALRVLRANEHEYLELVFIPDALAQKCDPEQFQKSRATCADCALYAHMKSSTVCQRCARNWNFRDHWQPND